MVRIERCVKIGLFEHMGQNNHPIIKVTSCFDFTKKKKPFLDTFTPLYLFLSKTVIFPLISYIMTMCGS